LKRRSAPPYGPLWLGKDFSFNFLVNYVLRMVLMVVPCIQELHEPHLVKKMLKKAISSYRDEQEQTCDITAR